MQAMDFFAWQGGVTGNSIGAARRRSNAGLQAGARCVALVVNGLVVATLRSTGVNRRRGFANIGAGIWKQLRMTRAMKWIYGGVKSMVNVIQGQLIVIARRTGNSSMVKRLRITLSARAQSPRRACETVEEFQEEHDPHGTYSEKELHDLSMMNFGVAGETLATPAEALASPSIRS